MSINYDDEYDQKIYESMPSYEQSEEIIELLKKILEKLQ